MENWKKLKLKINKKLLKLNLKKRYEFLKIINSKNHELFDSLNYLTPFEISKNKSKKAA